MKITLVKKANEAEGVKSFFFQSEKTISFLPGQYVYITLPKLNYPDQRGATRCFSISSAPNEDNLIRITTKIRQESGYKKTLDEISIGSIVSMDGPNGTFFLDKKETGPHIFLAGGIGITPFESMIEYLDRENLKDLSLNLIYSNSDEKIAFKKEIDGFAKKHGNIRVYYVISGKEGHLDKDKILKIVEEWGLNIKKSTWWICGPPGFSTSMESILSGLKVPSFNIRSEKFTGY